MIPGSINAVLDAFIIALVSVPTECRGLDSDNDLLKAPTSVMAPSNKLPSERYLGKQYPRDNAMSGLKCIDWHLCLWGIVSVREPTQK